MINTHFSAVAMGATLSAAALSFARHSTGTNPLNFRAKGLLCHNMPLDITLCRL